MRLIRDAKAVGGSAATFGIASALRSFAVLSIVGPTTIGVWKSAMALYTIAELSRLGSSAGMAVEIPVLLGKGEHGRAQEIAARAGGFSLVAGLTVAALLAVAGIFAEDSDYRLALWMMALVVFFAQPHQHLRELASARREFVVRARETRLAALLDVTLFLSLSYFFGLAGLGLATILCIALPAAYLARALRAELRFERPGKVVGHLVKRGLPLTAAEALYAVMRRADLLAISLLLGPTAAGYYGISLLIMDFALFLSAFSVHQVVSANLLHEFGRDGSLGTAAKVYEVPARLFAYVLPPLLGVGAIVMPPFVELLLPRYTEGIAAAQAMMWGIVFQFIHATLGAYFVAAQRVASLIKWMAAAVPVAAVLALGAIRAGFGLEGAAWAAVASMAIATGGQAYMARRINGATARQALRFVGVLYAPAIATLIATRLLIAADLEPLAPGYWALALKALVLLAAYAPVLALYEWAYSLIRLVRRGTEA